MYKLLYGIPAMFLPNGFEQKYLNNLGHIEDYMAKEDIDIWCDFELLYYEDYYTFGFETMLGFENSKKCREWIEYCLSCLTTYMKKNGYDTSKELDLYSVFTEGVNICSKFKTIEEAYACLKMMVYGFRGNGLQC